MKKIIRLVILIVLLGLAIVVKYIGISEIGNKISLGKRSVHVPVIGPSMYPTFAWCNDKGGPEDCSVSANQNSRRMVPEFFVREDDFIPELGMIVSINHEGGGIVKRIVGLPGDVLRLDGGYLYRNGEKVDEPYLWKMGSTYGSINGFVADCVDITVPQGSMFVLGDNRLMSGDTREFGLLKLADVKAYLPLTYQNNLGLANYPLTPKLASGNDYIKLIETINTIRKQDGLQVISHEQGLDNLATVLGDVLAKNHYNYDSLSTSGDTKKIEGKAISMGYGTGYLSTAFFPGIFDHEDYTYLMMEDDIKSIIVRPNLKKLGIVSHSSVDAKGCRQSITTLVGLE